jgi:hypothetical protein
MKSLRFSLLGSMLFCFYATICIAAVTRPSPLMSSILHTVRIGFLFASILGILLQRAEERSFWLGFAVFGWGFVGLAHLPWWGRPPLLVTSNLVWRLAPPGFTMQDLQFFSESCDSIENLIVALVGGLVGYRFGIRRNNSETQSLTPVTSPVQRNG